MVQLKVLGLLIFIALAYTACGRDPAPKLEPYQIKQAGIAAKRIVVSEGYPCNSVALYELDSRAASTLYCSGGHSYRIVDNNGQILVIKD